MRGYVITRAQLPGAVSGRARSEALAYRELHTRERATGALIAADVEAVRASAGTWRRSTSSRRSSRAADGRPLSLPATRHWARRCSTDPELARTPAGGSQRRGHRRPAASSTTRRTSCEVTLIIAGALIIGSVLRRRPVPAPDDHPAARATRRGSGTGDGRRVHDAAGASRPGPREITELAVEIEAMRERIVQELSQVRAAHYPARAPVRGSEPLQRRARAVRLRRLARPAGAAAQGRELLPGAALALPRPARRARRPVHRLRGRRRAAHAGADQRAARALAGRPRRASRWSRSSSRRLAAEAAIARGDRGDRRAGGGRAAAHGPRRRALLVSLFQNLIGNAIKFRGSEPPRVRVSRATRGRVAAVGHRQRHRDRARLRRADLPDLPAPAHPRGLRRERGSGWRCARKIVEYHGGTHLARSRASGGARFGLTLPIVKETHL